MATKSTTRAFSNQMSEISQLINNVDNQLSKKSPCVGWSHWEFGHESILVNMVYYRDVRQILWDIR